MSAGQRVGIIANTSWNILNFRLGLIKALKDNGYQIFIMAPKDEHSANLEQLGYEIHYVNKLSRKGTNPLVDILLIIELARLYKKLNLNFVLQYTIKPNIYGSIASFFSGVYAISTVTGLGYVFLSNGISSKIAKMLYRISLRFSHVVFFQNSDDKELFEINRLVPVSKSRLVNGSGIDTEYYYPAYCQEINTENKKESTTFLMISRLLQDKGVYEFITASKNIRQKYPQTEFIILGDYDEGNPTSINQDDIQLWKNEKIIQLQGFKKNTRDFICQSDVVVLPSYREGIPRVILEAFAMGKPSITTDAPGCKHVVDHNENGLICKVRDEKSLYDAMETFILLSGTEKIKMGINARKKAEEVYSIGQIVKTYLSVLSSIR